MRIWHRIVGAFLLSEVIWFVFATGFRHAFGDLQTAGLVLISGVVAIMLVAKG